jgi:hypothetical protein
MCAVPGPKAGVLDDRARALALAHLALCRRVAHRIRCHYLDRDDREGVGALALCLAALEYDPGVPAPFAAFAALRVGWAIRRADRALSRSSVYSSARGVRRRRAPYLVDSPAYARDHRGFAGVDAADEAAALLSRCSAREATALRLYAEQGPEPAARAIGCGTRRLRQILRGLRLRMDGGAPAG